MRMKAYRTKEVLSIKKIPQTILLAGFLFLLLIIPALAVDPAEENYLQIQKSLDLMEQYNGTEMTTAEYLEKIWPQVYAKISPEHKEKLAAFTHIWELKELDRTDGGTGIGFTLNEAIGRERFALMDAIEKLEITEGEYQAIAQTEIYLDLSEDLRKHLSGMVRAQRGPDVGVRGGASITEGETQWFSKNVTANVTRISVDLQWENPANIQNNLSITIYSPDRCVFGPFIEAESFYSNPQKMQIHTYIVRPEGVAEGEWWYCIQGVKVDGVQNYTI
ncbi:hypothetical protein McpAg1_03020 [Methanocorpusculaceae archaeon Ag1]|uniref:Uncharacterized protein n=2 Tax=Methanorbis furvi TaxID=3028299 RepID=A0AAE4S9Z8_9EURY|nr:hypothetical protein [Methanocorpusculaceae archaeon Ag1]